MPQGPNPHLDENGHSLAPTGPIKLDTDPATDFATPSVERVRDRGLVDGVEFSNDTASISRERAEDIAKQFLSGQLAPGQHRQVAALLAAFIFREYSDALDVDGDGVPDLPKAESSRLSWLKDLFGRGDFDDA